MACTLFGERGRIAAFATRLYRVRDPGAIAMRPLLIIPLVMLLSGAAPAAEIVDATGRTVAVPDHVTKILPAGPPAAVLLEAMAPDLMLGFPNPVSAGARAQLAPEAAGLPAVPRLTGKQDVSEQVRALKPDLIVDYGDVTPAYADLARATQERLGVPTLLLDGALAETPRALRLLGAALHREARAELLARIAEAMFALPVPTEARTVLYLRGSDDFRALAPGGTTADVFARLGWKVLAPEGSGTFRPVTLPQVVALDPDVLLFADARMRGVVAGSDAWRSLRAVRTGHAFVAPALPFGWVEEPPSLNRLLGVAWLGGHDATALAALFGAAVYGHAPSRDELAAVADGTRPLPP
jgi:iron complex transport system substrate-binding protein